MNKIILTIFVVVILFQIDNTYSQKARISTGFDAKITDVKCYSTFKVRFPNSDVYRRCGGCLVSNNKVLTSAKCVVNPFEGTNAVSATFSFGNYKTTRLGYGISKVAYPSNYVYSNRQSLNDIGIITLNRTVDYNALIAKSTPSQVCTPDVYVGQQLFVCGFGDTDNYGNRPNTLKCTYLTVIPCLSSSTTAANGGSTTTATTTGASTTAASTTAASTITGSTAAGSTAAGSTTVTGSTTSASSSPGIICTMNNDDRNVCHGDEGSPVFSNSTGTLELVGVVSYYPDFKANAPCQDGHKVVITQVGCFSSFITTNLI